jgi:hypothetical protein
VPQPTLTVASGSLSINGGNTVGLPTASVVTSGAAVTTTLANNSYSINVPQPTLSIASGSLSITGGNSVALPVAANASVVSSGVAVTTTLAANSYSINVPQPTLSIASGSLSITGGNSVALPVAPTVAGVGLAIVTGGPAYTVSVPTLTYNSNGILASGSNSIVITPALTLSGSTLSVGQTTNTINLASLSPWIDGAGTVTLSNIGDKVGIGTNNPAQDLQVESGTNAAISIVGNAANNSNLHFGTPANHFMGGIRYDNSTNSMNFWTFNNNNRIVILNNGNVGINTGAPTATLHVNGNVRIADGTEGANKVFTSDASGNGSWQNATGFSWGLLGNAATTPTANFIGTIDNNALNFRVNNQKAGTIDNANLNTAFGYLTYSVNSSGSDNSAFGAYALRVNTTGIRNTAMGSGAMYNNTTGQQNVAIGYNSLLSNTSGSNNVAVGQNALQTNGTGLRNTAVGFAALNFNTSSNDNTAVGNSALFVNTGVGNSALGSQALYSNQSGANNSASGVNALYNNTTGYNNTAAGYQALFGTTTGSNNTAHGMQAGIINTTGSNNTFVGYQANVSANNLTNAMAIGANATVSASNRVKLGNAASIEFDLALMPAGNAGISGQYLISSGAGAAPVWVSPGTGTAAAWSALGNAGTNTVTNFIGTTDARELNFKTNNALAITINTLGYVGIGTSTPSVKFENSPGGTTSGSGEGQASFYHNSGFGNAIHAESNTGGSRTGSTTVYARALLAGYNNNTTMGSNADAGANLFGSTWGLTAGGGNILGAPITSVGIAGNLFAGIFMGGNVGIGTNSPAAALHVNGSVLLANGTQGVDKVLASDASGNTSWKNSSINTGFSAYASSGQTLALSSQILFSSEDYDDGADFVSNEYVAPSAGVYHFDAHVRLNGFLLGGQYCYIYFAVNNTLVKDNTSQSSTNTFGLSISADLKLSAGDLVTVWIYAGTSGNSTVSGSFNTWFTGHRIY